MYDLRYGSQSKNEKPPTRAEINLAVAYYIMRGGKITKLKSGTCENPINPLQIGKGKDYIPYVSLYDDEANMKNDGIANRTRHHNLDW